MTDQNYSQMFNTTVTVLDHIEATGMGDNDALAKAMLKNQDKNNPAMVKKGK